MDFPPKVVASVTSFEEAGEALKLGADIVEVRADLISGDPVSLIKDIYKEHDCPIIATIRPEYEGGRFRGDDHERARLFKEIAPYAEFIDVELRAGGIDEIVRSVEGTEAKTIVSYHDFDKTPSNAEMLGILDRALEKGDIAKLAVMPLNYTDVLRLYEVTLISNRPVCTISMGRIGMHSRLMACVYGSVFSYGYVREPVAPGQIRVDAILQGLKIMGLR